MLRLSRHFVFTNLLLFFAFFSAASFANDTSFSYQFHSPAEQQQFQTVTEQLRCLVCQNQSLWDSNASLARDLRMEVYTKIKQGYTNDEIKKYLVDRYGQFIVFKPAFNKITFLLWTIPFALLITGFFIVIFFTRNFRRQT